VRQPPVSAPLHIKADLGPLPPQAEPDPLAGEIAPPPQPDAEAPELAPLSPPDGVSTQRFVAAVLGKVNPPLARWLARELQLNPRQLALTMIRAYEALPASEFQRFGASPPHSEEARRFLTAARTARFGLDTSPAKTAEFARLYMAKIKSLM
jgi:hypothetical protein